MVMIIAIFVIGIFTVNFLSSNITFNVVDEKAPYIEIVSPLDSEIDLHWDNDYLARTFGGVLAVNYVFKIEIAITIFDDQGDLQSFYIYLTQGMKSESLIGSFLATKSDIDKAGGAIYNIRVGSKVVQWIAGYLPTSREFTLRIIASDGYHNYVDTLTYTVNLINKEQSFSPTRSSVDLVNEEKENIPPPPSFEPIPEPETTTDIIGVFGTETTTTAKRKSVGIPELFFLTPIALVILYKRRKRDGKDQ